MLDWLGIRFATAAPPNEFLLLDCSHVYGLVLLSYVVASFASFTALDISELITRATGKARTMWMALFAVAMGGGIWSMHFIGMLAFQAPILISYDPLLTLFSLLVTIAGCLAAIALNSAVTLSIPRLVVSGVLLGFSIVTMHYSGMAAIESAATVRYQPLLFVVSVAIAVSASIVALTLAWVLGRSSHQYVLLLKLGAALVMGVAICGMHYTAMAAAEFYVDRPLSELAPAQAQGGLAIAVGLMAITIIAVALLNSIFGKRLRAQEALFDKAARRYGQVFDTVPDAIITFRQNWEILEANQSARQLFALEMNHYPVLDELLSGFDDAFMQTVLGAQGRYFMLTARASGGREFPAELSISPMADAAESDVFLLIGRDISAREELNQQLAEHALELKESNEALDRFASVVSHDLRDPLRKIRLFGGKLKHSLGDELPEKSALYLERMLSSADRLQSMVTGVLDYSRLGTNAGEREWVSLQELTETIVADLVVAAEEAGAEFEFTSLPEIYCIPVLFRQVMQNLLANAVKYRAPDEPPRIRIKAERVKVPSGEHVQIKVIDNGVGFDPGSSEKIFGIFSRAHGAGEFEGLGIGLATCAKIVRLHGGAIYASSEVDRGSVFTVELPIPLV